MGEVEGVMGRRGLERAEEAAEDGGGEVAASERRSREQGGDPSGSLNTCAREGRQATRAPVPRHAGAYLPYRNKLYMDRRASLFQRNLPGLGQTFGISCGFPEAVASRPSLPPPIPAPPFRSAHATGPRGVVLPPCLPLPPIG